jgi:predicted AAA+ superfamily ATPase
VLGSASIDLLRQSSETLAGRIAFLELTPVHAAEAGAIPLQTLWLRGGFPESLLAASDDLSLRWRRDFIRTYLERDVPQLGPRIPAETLRRFWTMLAHQQGGLLNAAHFARSLGVDGKTVASYLDLLVDLLLVRRLTPWHRNVGKRLVKSPKVYVRDSGLVHALLGLGDTEALLGHPIAGASWEGWVIESLLACAPDGSEATFYRTSAGAEIDLLITLPGSRGRPWAIEIKRSLTPTLERGFHLACEDVRPARKVVVYPGAARFPLGKDIEALGVIDFAAQLLTLGGRLGT